MRFVTHDAAYQQQLQTGNTLLKKTTINGQLIDAWFAEQDDKPLVEIKNGIQLQHTSNGIFGSIAVALTEPVAATTRTVYQRLLTTLALYPDYTLLRCWNYVPNITQVYQQFNAGRYQAFQEYYGDALSQHPAPAASAVGTQGPLLKIEFLAVQQPLAFIENKDQVPAYQYSAYYGKLPPYFSRGSIFINKGQRLLLSSGTASIVGETSVHAGDIYEQLARSILNLRILAGQFNLKKYNIHYGFALEDIVLLRVYYKQENDRPFLERYLPKVMAPGCQLTFQQADICREELLVELEAVFVKKGETEQGRLPKYYFTEGRIKTESFEIHVAEHCNLRCRDCCNISPFNAKHFMSISEVEAVCDFIKTNLRPDVFKIAGGEPTLHPELDKILQTIQQAKTGCAVRVITNGLLLHRMSDLFWENVDQLTISHYISAPMKPQFLEEVKAKAKKYEVVLNIKYVEQFNEIFVNEKITDVQRIQNIYDDCWMRHRCLIVRHGYFYKCTRSAYMNETLSLKGIASSIDYTVEDGIAVNDPNFKEKALAYLNETKPLFSCQYCLGVSGNLRENIQLKKADIAVGG
ncbi:4Fe-4S single cluster domain-containing protein [Chitinophaga costaii]|uniref:4Fe-4S single cluster domain-containing protein n=1 Tax=Chitinophaga costaii TaxID=1335309 RepID=A0A1C3ZX70_9BACT|nr:radical SAM protein [Chitinophaga costaii]PUZ30540.1 radical SAM protein [Chitinophaga costaii]SCB86911.1 4Fe-4S single cluster domain-containing protein [Chitinophaga costaii]